MYQALLILQCLGIGVSMIEIVYTLRQKHTRGQDLILACCIAILINNLGYFYEMTSVSADTSLQAVKFLYLGKAFAPLIFTLIIFNFCRMEVNKIVQFILIVVHMGTFVLVETCEYQHLYYSSIDFVDEGLFPHLVLGHGPLYWVYNILIVVYLVVSLSVCIYAYKRSISAVQKSGIRYFMVVIVIMFAGFAAFLSGITLGYDTTAIAYVITQTLMLMAFFRDNFFENLESAKDYVADSIAQGLVILDTSDNILYLNDQAREIYPELATGDAKEAIKEVVMYNKTQNNIFCGQNVYKVSSREFVKGGETRGTVYVFDDITSSYNYTNRLERDVKSKTQEITKMQRSVIASFANIVEARDGVTGQHIKHTSAYVEILTNALADKEKYKDILTKPVVERIIDAAPLHDIGKIAIEDRILNKKGRLTEEEFRIIQTHSEIGAEMILDLLLGVESDEYVTTASEMAHYHHEKWNGTGYPKGLSMEEIPISARIMAVADVYDALVSKRSYKDAFPKAEARRIIEEGSGNHFDPDIVEVFMENIDKIEAV